MVEGKKPGFKLEKVGQVSCHVCLTSEIDDFGYLQLQLITVLLVHLLSAYSLNDRNRYIVVAYQLIYLSVTLQASILTSTLRRLILTTFFCYST